MLNDVINGWRGPKSIHTRPSAVPICAAGEFFDYKLHFAQ
jgi:hypothetical protein